MQCLWFVRDIWRNTNVFWLIDWRLWQLHVYFCQWCWVIGWFRCTRACSGFVSASWHSSYLGVQPAYKSLCHGSHLTFSPHIVSADLCWLTTPVYPRYASAVSFVCSTCGIAWGWLQINTDLLHRNKHCWRAFRWYQHRWPWTTLNPKIGVFS